jgi:signal peptidase I
MKWSHFFRPRARADPPKSANRSRDGPVAPVAPIADISEAPLAPTASKLDSTSLAQEMREIPETPDLPVAPVAPVATRPARAQRRSAEPGLRQELTLLMAKLLAICGVAILAFTFLYGLQRSTDPDMAPAVKDGDLVMFYRLDRQYAAGDLLILTFQGSRQIRRVVAIAGDTVDVTENGLMINGSYQQELEIYSETRRYAEGTELPVLLNEGEVFVLGDKRDNATDSRLYGPVKTKDTLGTVITIIRRRNL